MVRGEKLHSVPFASPVFNKHQKIMKKISSILSLFLLTFMLACGGGDKNTEDNNTQSQASNPSSEPESPSSVVANSSESAMYSYNFEGFNKTHQSTNDPRGMITYNINEENSMFRVGVAPKQGLPMMINILGDVVADKDNLPKSYTKTGADDKSVGVSIPIEVEDGVFRQVGLVDGSVVFTKLDLENGVFEGTVKGNASGKLSTKSMRDMVKITDPKEMQEAQAEMSKVTEGSITVKFSMTTKKMMIMDLRK